MLDKIVMNHNDKQGFALFSCILYFIDLQAIDYRNSTAVLSDSI